MGNLVSYATRLLHMLGEAILHVSGLFLELLVDTARKTAFVLAKRIEAEVMAL